MKVDVKAKLEIDIPRTMSRFDPKYQAAQKWLDNEVLKDSEPYVPFDTGMLARSGQTGTQLGSGDIVYSAPYAKRLYYGKGMHFNTHAHPQASAQWFEKAKAVRGKNWVEGAERVLKK